MARTVHSHLSRLKLQMAIRSWSFTTGRMRKRANVSMQLATSPLEETTKKSLLEGKSPQIQTNSQSTMRTDDIGRYTAAQMIGVSQVAEPKRWATSSTSELLGTLLTARTALYWDVKLVWNARRRHSNTRLFAPQENRRCGDKAGSPARGSVPYVMDADWRANLARDSSSNFCRR
jgi:hypothetical protein